MSTFILFPVFVLCFIGGKELTDFQRYIIILPFTEQTLCTSKICTCINFQGSCVLSGIHYHFKIVLGVTIHVCVDVDGAHAGTFTCTLSLLVTIKDWTYALFLGSFQNWRRRGEHTVSFFQC